MHALLTPVAVTTVAMTAAFLTGVALLAVRLRRTMRVRLAPASPVPYFRDAVLPRTAPVPEIPEAHLVRVPITTARKAIRA